MFSCSVDTRPPGVTNVRFIPPQNWPSVSHFLHGLAALAEVNRCHARLQRRCIIPSVAYQSSPLPLSGRFHRNFNFGGALARLMQFRFLTPAQQEEAASQQVGAQTTGLRCFTISHPRLSSCPRLRLLVIYFTCPAACEPESRRRCHRRHRRHHRRHRYRRHYSPSFSLFLRLTLKC